MKGGKETNKLVIKPIATYCWKVQGLVVSLRAKWPSLTCPRSNSSRFWQLQWKKHGTCSVLSQNDYFLATLRLKAMTNILYCLQLAGIWPDDQRYRTLTSVVSAIQACVGHTIYVQCNSDNRGRSQLYQVYICVNQTGTGLIDCPVFPRRTCPSKFRFPKF
ncbi:Ribonuclease [Rhynchospora pubera]|uniref:Ribonuclease n=1 Tax=Rhynchospora pubera TaxID=906938 RepID=A0AAV8CAU3_9POAL|nr:Ribonuclease [Rhynchospora pubera]